MSDQDRTDGPTEYRIEYSIQRLGPGDDDFTEIGFGSSSGWSTPEQAVHMIDTDVQHYAWETSGDMPDPDEVEAAVQAWKASR